MKLWKSKNNNPVSYPKNKIYKRETYYISSLFELLHLYYNLRLTSLPDDFR